MGKVYAVGEPLFAQARPLPETAELRLSGTTPELVIVAAGLTRPETWALRKGKLEVKVFNPTPEQIFFLYRIQGFCDWSDAPYHRALEEAYRPLNLPDPESIPEGRGLSLLLIAARAEDSRIVVLRMVGLPTQVSRTLLRAVAGQPTQVSPDYDHQRRSLSLSLTSQQMADLAD